MVPTVGFTINFIFDLIIFVWFVHCSLTYYNVLWAWIIIASNYFLLCCVMDYWQVVLSWSENWTMCNWQDLSFCCIYKCTFTLHTCLRYFYHTIMMYSFHLSREIVFTKGYSRTCIILSLSVNKLLKVNTVHNFVFCQDLFWWIRQLHMTHIHQLR